MLFALTIFCLFGCLVVWLFACLLACLFVCVFSRAHGVCTAWLLSVAAANGLQFEESLATEQQHSADLSDRCQRLETQVGPSFHERGDGVAATHSLLHSLTPSLTHSLTHLPPQSLAQVESLTQQLSIAHETVADKDAKIKELREVRDVWQGVENRRIKDCAVFCVCVFPHLPSTTKRANRPNNSNPMYFAFMCLCLCLCLSVRVCVLIKSHEAEIASLREELVPADSDMQQRVLALNDKLQTARDAEIEAITKLNDESARNRVCWASTTHDGGGTDSGAAHTRARTRTRTRTHAHTRTRTLDGCAFRLWLQERELQLEQEISRLKARAAAAEYRGESKAMIKLKTVLFTHTHTHTHVALLTFAVSRDAKQQELLALQKKVEHFKSEAESANQSKVFESPQ